MGKDRRQPPVDQPPNPTGKHHARDDFDIFIGHSIFPEPKTLFSAEIKSVDQIIDTCLVVLDTTVLLIPYTVTTQSLDQIRQTYEKLCSEKRIFIPAQAAREFAKNRPKKLAELYQQLLDTKSKVIKPPSISYPLLASEPQYEEANTLAKEINERVKKYTNALDALVERVKGWAWDDPVSLLYRKLFPEGFVFEPTIEEHSVIEDLERRTKHQIPPGYKDSGKQDGGVGDLLIWYSILELGRTQKKSIILVSGDEKADWWHRSGDFALYPRFELVDEFRRVTDGEAFHILRFSQFLDRYGAGASVVAEVRLEEEEAARGNARASRKRPFDVLHAYTSVRAFLINQYPYPAAMVYTRSRGEFDSKVRGLDFSIQFANGDSLGVIVKYYSGAHDFMKETDIGWWAEQREAIESEGFTHYALVLVATDYPSARALLSVEASRHLIRMGRRLLVEVTIGFINDNGEFEVC